MIRHSLPRRPAPRTPTRAPRRAAVVLLFVGALPALAACSSTDASGAPAGSTSWSVGTPTSPGGASGTGAPSAWGTVGGSPTRATTGAPGGAGTGTGTDVPPGSASGPPAQDAAAASRDKVPAAVAALPSPDRVRQVPRGNGGSTRVSTPGDGVWMISRPAGASAGYAEVLHLDGAGRIVRAYPFAGVAPQWLLVTPGAVFCGRRGTDAASDAMVCRIDRRSGDLRVLVTADRAPHTAIVEADVAGRPGTWVVDDTNYTADLGVAPQVGAELTFSSGGVLRLSTETLGTLGS